MSYREATQREIQRAGQEAAEFGDWVIAKEYAEATYGPTVARILFEVDHNFDDGEEHRYIGNEHGDEKAWDAAGNELPVIGKWSEWDDKPDFNDYEPWHMEFDLTAAPKVTKLYVEAN